MMKISVIIPTYNRYKFLLNAINSVKNQTYKNVEIIVVNDGSSEEEYYTKRIEGVKMLHMDKNSKEIKGYACVAIARNYGMKIASGDYIAFLDDDDIWLPRKLEMQIKSLEDPLNIECQMTCTDGYVGGGEYNERIHETNGYQRYMKEKAYQYILHHTGMTYIPKVFDSEYIKKNNTIMTSSCMVHRDVIRKVGEIDELPIGGKHNGLYEDYEYWKRCLKYTKCLYVDEPLIYYDLGHGYGNNY